MEKRHASYKAFAKFRTMPRCSMTVPAGGRFSSRSIRVSLIESEVVEHQLEIAAVGLEIDVEDVADHRDAPRDRVESYIDQHLEKLVVRHAETARLVDDEEADRRSAEIADAGDQTEHGVRAERDAGAGNSERRVHKPGQAPYTPEACELLDRYRLLFHTSYVVPTRRRSNVMWPTSACRAA